MSAVPWKASKTAAGLRQALDAGARLVEDREGQLLLPCLSPRGKPALRATTWRRLLLILQDGRCLYCDHPIAVGTFDHVVPQSKGGARTIWNLALACRACNGGKADRHVTPSQGARHDALLAKLRACVQPYINERAA